MQTVPIYNNSSIQQMLFLSYFFATINKKRVQVGYKKELQNETKLSKMQSPQKKILKDVSWSNL